MESHLDQGHDSSVNPAVETAKTPPPLEYGPDAVLLRSAVIIKHRTLFLPVVATLTKSKLIGVVACDSGRICIADPSHLKAHQGSVRLPAWNLHTSVDTEIGDGEFSVYEERDKRGRLRRVIIELD